MFSNKLTWKLTNDSVVLCFCDIPEKRGYKTCTVATTNAVATNCLYIISRVTFLCSLTF